MPHPFGSGARLYRTGDLARFLPNGDLLLLERSYTVAEGVKMRLRRIKGDAIAKGSVADGPILFEADMAYQIDNMEAMDVWRRADGALMVAIPADDRRSAETLMSWVFGSIGAGRP